MRSTENVKVMRNIFSTIERRDAQGFRELVHPDVEMHWPASLPYGGTARGLTPQEPRTDQLITVACCGIAR